VSCDSNDPHLHHLAFPTTMAFETMCPVLMIDGTIQAFVPNEALAARITALLAAHGLVAVVDDLAPTWPAPTGRPA
jgi:hypothetical protein